MTDVRIVLSNNSPVGGVFLTPLWFGFHKAGFDPIELGQTASAGLQAIAEDGNAMVLGAEMRSFDADAQGGVIAGAGGPIRPGETVSRIIAVDGNSNDHLSLASMVVPSNDAFIGTEAAVQLFTASGKYMREVNLSFTGEDVLDSGTEQNTERDAAFINQTAPNTGVDENGVVARHQGFNGSLGHPDGEQIILGGTTAAGTTVDPVAGDFTIPGAQIAHIHINQVQLHQGTAGRDTIHGNRADDLVSAGDGNDFVFGGLGWDVLDGGSGADLIEGGRGNDMLLGGEGDDVLKGGMDDDYLDGGAGNDNLAGGRGADHFDFRSAAGNDVISDFRMADGDRIVLSGFDTLADVMAVAQQTASGVVLDLAGQASVLIRGVDLAELSTDSFIFA